MPKGQKATSYHVVPSPQGGWAVRREGAERASGVFARQSDAISHARGLARRSSSRLVVHGRDGRVRKSDSNGYEPLPPRDRPRDRGKTPKGFGSLGGAFKVRSDIDVTKPIYRQVSKEAQQETHGNRTK
jgi:hypothetical protein